MITPSQDSLVLAAIALVELAQDRQGAEGEALAIVAEYLLNLSSADLTGDVQNGRATC